MSGPPPIDYDPRRLFPFGLSPIPELPSELASEVSSVYSYYDDSEVNSEAEDEEEEEEIRSRISIMYSGSCSSVKSNRTLDHDDESDESETEEEETDEEDTEVEEENHVEEQQQLVCQDEEKSSEHYNSLVTHVMHQRAFTSNQVEVNHHQEQQEECGHSDIEDEDEAICVSENAAIITDNQVYLINSNNNNTCNNDMGGSQENCTEVSPGAATASEIFRHLQATHGKEEITTELAKILSVLHTTLKEEESSSSSSNSNTGSGSDSESRSSSDDEPDQKSAKSKNDMSSKPEQTNSKLPESTQKPATVPLGKPPKYPSFKNRTLGPDIEERIRELSISKPGRSGKEEMNILSKILVTLLCSCRSTAATQELKKIIRHFKEAASEAGDEFATEEFDQATNGASNHSKRKKSRRRRRRWSSGATSSHSSHGSEADSHTNTLTPCNTDSKSSGTDDERENNFNAPHIPRKGSDPLVSTRLRFNVVVEDPPVVNVGGQEHPETNVSFTISLPRRSSIEMSAEASYSSNHFQTGSSSGYQQEHVSKEEVEQEEEEEEEEEWEWEEDDDTGENAPDSHRQDSIDSGGSMTTRKLLTDMECGAYNSDSLGSPSAGASGQSGEQSNNQSPSAIESRPESSNDLSRKRSGRSRDNSCSSSTNNNLFTHLEETFKVLNGAYKIITGSKPEGGQQVRADSRCGEEDSKKSFEEVLQGVSNECAQLENEIRKTSRPTSKMSTCSRRSTRSRNGTGEEEEEDGWEYYYEEEEEEEFPESGSVSISTPVPPVLPPVQKQPEQPASKPAPGSTNKPDDHGKHPLSRPTSRQTRSRPSSRSGSRPNSRLRTKTPLGDVLEDDENGDWEWEYYYEEGDEEFEDEELRRLSPTSTTAPTTRATSPFPRELPTLQRAHIVSPTTCWEEVDNRGGPYIHFRPGEIGLARESVHADPNVMCDSMLSVALAAEYLGQTAGDLAAVLPPDFMQDEREEKKRRRKKEDKEKKRHRKDGKFLPKIGVKELANRLEPKLFQDVDTGTKMVMDQNIASSAIAKQKKNNSRNEVYSQSQQQQQQLLQQQQQQRPQQQQQSKQYWSEPSPVKRPDPAIIVHDTGNPHQVTVHQGGQATVVTMRRSGGARTKEAVKVKQRSPSEGSEAYGTGSTTSVIEQPHMEDDEEHPDEGRGHSRHSRLFRLLQDSDYTDSESETKSEFGSGHRISLKGVDDLVATKEADMDSLCSVERKHSFRSIRSSGKESDCDSITSSGRGIGGGGGGNEKSSSMQKEMAVKRFMTLNLHSRDYYPSSSELSTPTSPVYNYAPDCPQLLSPERRRAQLQYRHSSSAFEEQSAGAPARGGAAQQLKAASRLSGTGSPKTTSDLYRGSPIRNSPKLELELMELAHLPSAPSFAMRNIHSRPGKL